MSSFNPYSTPAKNQNFLTATFLISIVFFGRLMIKNRQELEALRQSVKTFTKPSYEAF